MVEEGTWRERRYRREDKFMIDLTSFQFLLHHKVWPGRRRDKRKRNVGGGDCVGKGYGRRLFCGEDPGNQEDSRVIRGA